MQTHREWMPDYTTRHGDRAPRKMRRVPDGLATGEHAHGTGHCSETRSFFFYR